MATEKFSVSTSSELFEALERLRRRRGQPRSDLVEMLLREHPLVRREIRAQRGQGPRARGKKGRASEELRALARAARRQWDKREAAGEVALLDR